VSGGGGVVRFIAKLDLRGGSISTIDLDPQRRAQDLRADRTARGD
jgi:hypothetical protein